jgi:hypothetical protein
MSANKHSSATVGLVPVGLPGVLPALAVQQVAEAVALARLEWKGDLPGAITAAVKRSTSQTYRARHSPAIRTRAGPQPGCSPTSSIHARAIEQD